MVFAKEYYVDPKGANTSEVGYIERTLEVLLDCFPSLSVDESHPQTSRGKKAEAPKTSQALLPRLFQILEHQSLKNLIFSP